MPDENKQIVADPNRSAEDYIKLAEEQYIVPALIRENYPNLIKMIFETKSMDQEEREYWLQIMPIMSEDQVTKLLEIMTNEKQQLDEIGKNENNSLADLASSAPAPLTSEDMKKRMEDLKRREQAEEDAEKSRHAAHLEELENL